MQLLTENVYAVPKMSVGRVYLITGRDGLALVDTSLSAQTPQRLEAQLKARGQTLADLRHIFITHAHPDHTGGLAEFQRLTSARTYAHRRDALVIRGEMVNPRPPKESLKGLGRLMAMGGSFAPPPPARVDMELKGGDTLDDILPGLTVVELPGHSPGQIGFWWPERRLLIGGDVMLHLPWGLTLPLAAYTSDMAEARRSIRKVAEMDVDILALGHGRPLVGGAAARVRAFAARLKD